eukprot:TRINITY_DN8323_c0_g2_i1.p1 TRINITY_DN8323_c0_g2~~TRINITY_DN8323_c0_g2_i1.p1  ORF type:complete len:4833 (+),score=938.40 TRINITY_DN8323_c0_g2_i1:126-14624(+)
MAARSSNAVSCPPLGGAAAGAPQSSSFGLKILPAAILRNVLQQYPSGAQFFLEALQNADDTGRARNFRVLLDRRSHAVTSMRPPAVRKDLQGAAIVFNDDAGFTERDWRSLQYMCDSEKRASPSQTGAFGMGSRSYFHITDVLQVLSGTRLSWLDPDNILESGNYGEQVDFVKDTWRNDFPDEASPFEGVFGCDLRSEFKGTIIRAALRSEERADTCTFMPKSFELSRAERIFDEFEETLKNGEVMLFLTSVTCVELWTWDNGNSEPDLRARARIGAASGHALPAAVSSPRDVRDFLREFSTFEALGSALLSPNGRVPSIQDFVQTTAEFPRHDASAATTPNERLWFRYGEFARDEETVALGVKCLCVPMITLALSVGNASTCGAAATEVQGRLFTGLPLPLTTALPVHINAAFRLHVNRRAMWRLSQDLEGDHRSWARWNDHLIGVFSPRVYAAALKRLAGGVGGRSNGFAAWPVEEVVERDFSLILDPLVQLLAQMAVLPAVRGGLVKPADAVYFPTPTKALHACRHQLLELSTQVGFTVVDPPDHVVHLLSRRGALQTKPCLWGLLEVVLPLASKLEDNNLASIVLAYLEWCASWPREEILELGSKLAALRWVPTEGGGATRTAADCFNPKESPAALDVVRKGRAKLAALVDAANLDADAIWKVMCLHGAKSEITWEDAVVEAETIARASPNADSPGVAQGHCLLMHLRARCEQMAGDRGAALRQLWSLAWVPAAAAGVEPTGLVSDGVRGEMEADTTRALMGKSGTRLFAPKDIFPLEARRYVWAVAPSLDAEDSSTLRELRAGRSLDAEPAVLAQHLKLLVEALQLPVEAAARSSTADIASCVCAPNAAPEHLRAAFRAPLPLEQLLSKAVLPAAHDLSESKRAALILAFLTWAVAELPESNVVDLGRQLADLRWVPTEDSGCQPLGVCFSANNNPEGFEVVRRYSARLDVQFMALGLGPDDTRSMSFRALHLCGLKNGLRWEDTVAETEFIAGQRDVGKAETLLLHIDRHHASFLGDREAALSRLRSIAWVPAMAPNPDHLKEANASAASRAPQFAKLSEVFQPSARPLVWAVAPTLSLEKALALQELRCGRTVENEPGILAEQVSVVLQSLSFLQGSSALVHLRAAFGALPLVRALLEVVLVVAPRLDVDRRGILCLAFLDFAGMRCDSINPEVSGHASRLEDLGRPFADVSWIPTADGGIRAIGDCFDPSAALENFVVVQRRRASLDALIVAAGVNETAVWRVLRCCGMKTEITWEDAVEEAEACITSVNVDGATKLFNHISNRFAAMQGGRDAVLSRLRELPWVPASLPTSPGAGVVAQAKNCQEGRLLTLNELFPSAARSVVWAVAPSMLDLDDSPLLELRPRRSVEAETSILVDQLCSLLVGLHCREDMAPLVCHVRAVLAALPASRTLAEVVQPACERLLQSHLPLRCLLLAVFDWAATALAGDTSIRELDRLSHIAWVPREDGVNSRLADCFDPEESPGGLLVVQRRRARISDDLAAMGLSTSSSSSRAPVWRVLRQCGMKTELTWEDAVEEATDVAQHVDMQRSGVLFAHLSVNVSNLCGARTECLERLRVIPWVPATRSGMDPAKVEGGATGNHVASQLLALSEVFSAAEAPVVWAVAPTLCAKSTACATELRPGRTVQADTTVLAKQAHAVAGLSPVVAVQHLRVVFAVLGPRRSLNEVVLPACQILEDRVADDKLCGDERRCLLILAFLEWVATKTLEPSTVPAAAGLRDNVLEDIGEALSAVKWLPTELAVLPARECFDPAASGIFDFSVASARRPSSNVETLIAAAGLAVEPTWRALRLTGLKQQLTWEDAAIEAADVAAAGTAACDEPDGAAVARSEKLLSYLRENYERLSGSRDAALERLQTIPWAPCLAPVRDIDLKPKVQLLALKEVFPLSQREFVWAVASCLNIEDSAEAFSASRVRELSAGRCADTDPEVLRTQLGALVLAAAAAADGGTYQQRSDTVSITVSSKTAWRHARRLFEALPPQRMILEVILPAAKEMSDKSFTRVVLAFLDFARTLRECDVRALGSALKDVSWVPTAADATGNAGDEQQHMQPLRCCFDPRESSIEAFGVFRRSRAALHAVCAELDVDQEPLWKTLRLCGLKNALTWEDVVEEAEAVAQVGDVTRAGQLFLYVDSQHMHLAGDRDVALARLQEVAWVPGVEPTTDPATVCSRLYPCSDLFAPSAHKLVWAVAPCLDMEANAELEELRPGKSIDEDPRILLQQVRAIADLTAAKCQQPGPTDQGDVLCKAPLLISQDELDHLLAVFMELRSLSERFPTLANDSMLENVACVPCLPPDPATQCAALFPPRRAAFQALHDHRALYPALGIVKPMDYTIRAFAEAVDVPKEPSAEALADLLQRHDVEELDTAVTLALELAARVRSGEALPQHVVVPTSCGLLKVVAEVYIDDASWRRRELLTLHPRISAEAGGLLGCTSVRAEMIKQCEDLGEDAEGDPFGQEADLVSQVKQLLQEYGESADLVKEFVQNSDDAGATSLTFIVDEESFGTETIIDPRVGALQGPAVYICSDKPLTDEDIANMQRVGASKKRLDFSSSGRFGVGLNVMYRFCDCPQLLANNCLHYFDLTRGHVAQPGGRRGRKFSRDAFRGNFPDSYAPFEGEVVGKFPTVFRLALRTENSDLGLAYDIPSVVEELQQAACQADKMLLFARNLSRLEFYSGSDLMVAYQSEVKDMQGQAEFFKGLPSTPMQLKPGRLLSHLTHISITSETQESSQTAEWAITHRVGVTDDTMLKVLRQQFDKPGGVALFPHGAAAVRLHPYEEPRCGRICCGLPTVFRTNSSAWVHGGFALLSSRKSLPLPEEGDETLTLDKKWNKMLVEGPVAEALHALILHCSGLVMYQGFLLEQYFGLFPVRGEVLHTLLATATFKAALKSAVFPVQDGSKITWTTGPTPTFFCSGLTDGLQMALVSDGMKLVALPDELVAEYEVALGKPRKRLEGHELCGFLAKRFAELHGNKAVELELADTGMACLMVHEFAVDLLSCIAKSLWKRHYEANAKRGPWALCNFNPKELKDLPLLLTANNKITTFGDGIVKLCTRRDLLPTRRDLYVDKECHQAILDAVDSTAEGISRVVQVDLPWIRPFSLKDLVPFREDLLSSFRCELPYSHPENSTLRNFWAVVAESIISEEGPKKSKTHSSQTNASWTSIVGDWPVLPVRSPEGSGMDGECCVSIKGTTNLIALTLIEQDENAVQSLTVLLRLCGLSTIQGEALADERVANLLRPFVVTSADGLLSALVERGKLDALSAAQRHDLLAYYSVLSLKGTIDIASVRRLSLFKTATGDPSYTALVANRLVCSIDESDPHAKALCRLVPPGVVLLAWPTQQVKPIYEQFGVQLCSGEDFMVNYVLPALPSICSNDESEGGAAQPFLEMLHTFVCSGSEISERVKSAASQTRFVPSLDGTSLQTPGHYITCEASAAVAFRSVLGAAGYLPKQWLLQRSRYVELMVSLGMGKSLTPAMILLCARHLDTAFEEILAARTVADTGAADGVKGKEANLAAEQALEGCNAEKSDDGDTVAMVSGASDSEKDRVASQGACDSNEEKANKDLPAELQTMSRELIEEFAFVAEELWPDASKAQSSDSQVQDMTRLLEAAGLRVMLARTYNNPTACRREVKSRNSRRQTSQRPVWKMDEESEKLSELILVPLGNAVFEHATQTLWTVCAIAIDVGPRLRSLIDRHRSEINAVFSAYVAPEDGPPELVLQHLANLCSLLDTDGSVAYVKPGSVLHEDLKACWFLLSQYANYLCEPRMQELVAVVSELPCVAIASEDVADRPAEEILLTVPRYAFFHLPIFQGREANLRLYLRQCKADTSQEIDLFRALGAREKPAAIDYANASARVAERAGALGQLEWLSTVVEACVRGVFDEANYLLEQGLEMTVHDLHMFATDGSIRPAKELVWLDAPRWASRCEGEPTLHFCALSGHDQREVAKCLVKCAGVRSLSAIVYESRLTDDASTGADTSASADIEASEQEGADKCDEMAPPLKRSKGLKDCVERMIQSYELASGLRAVMLHAQEHGQQPVPLAKLREQLCAIRFQLAPGQLRSGLRWVVGGALLQGSERDQQVFYDASSQSIFLHRTCDLNDETFVAELVAALRFALPLLWNIEAFMLEAVLRCALRDGPGGIQTFLEQRDIKLGGFLDKSRSRHLGPGDQLPEDLQDHVVWSMNATFSEGESAAIAAKDIFIIVEVARWPEGKQQPGKGLSRSYRLKVGADTYEPRKHYEVYKIHGTVQMNNTKRTDALVLTDGGNSYDFEGSGDPGDEGHIADVKRYLREMSKMPPEEYKSVMRRLFKTWHPDKAGDTPLSRAIFRLIRRHEQWYKKRLAGEVQEDDSWLDEERADDAEGLALESSAPIFAEDETVFAQASWFDEFETEMREARLSPEAVEAQFSKSMAVPPSAAPGPGPAPGSPGRIVDKNQAPRWLHQAKLELLAACSLMKPGPGLRILPSAAVWHCEQAVEMCIKAAMYRTCGVSEDESIGSKAHDITTFVQRLRYARANTTEQEKGQDVPIEDFDVQWLKTSYLNARYPRARSEKIPAELYPAKDGERAIHIADRFLKWASTIEDLPDPGVEAQESNESERMLAMRRRRWTELMGQADNKGMGEAPSGRPPVHAKGPPLVPAAGAPGGLASSFANPSSKFSPPAPPSTKGVGKGVPQQQDRTATAGPHPLRSMSKAAARAAAMPSAPPPDMRPPPGAPPDMAPPPGAPPTAKAAVSAKRPPPQPETQDEQSNKRPRSAANATAASAGEAGVMPAATAESGEDRKRRLAELKSRLMHSKLGKFGAKSGSEATAAPPPP